MTKKLSPLSKDEFADLYNKAWENGWVYGKFFDELYDEYLVNWVYFVDYLDILSGKTNGDRMYYRINTDKDVVKIEFDKQTIFVIAPDHLFNYIDDKKISLNISNSISFLIGEAPPYWKGNATPDDKSYFYNPNYKKSSTWFTAPLKWKGFTTKSHNGVEKKSLELISMAKAGIILFDVFPFPIIQDTKIRQAVSGKFPDHVKKYFVPKYKEITKYLGKVEIAHGLLATVYGSLHLLFGDKTRGIIEKRCENIYKKSVLNVAEITFVYDQSFIVSKDERKIAAFKNNKPTALFKYVYKLISPLVDHSKIGQLNKISFLNNNYVKMINEIFSKNKLPILMDGSGGVSFEIFFNSDKNPTFNKASKEMEKTQKEIGDE